jgi:hypothetical protein
MSRFQSFEQEGDMPQPGVNRPTYGPMRGAPIKPVKSSAPASPLQFPGMQQQAQPPAYGMPALGAENQMPPQAQPQGRGMPQMPSQELPSIAPTRSRTRQSVDEMYQNAPPMPGQMKPPGPGSDYIRAYEQLEKSRQAVAVDPRFSPEQRQQAFERIAARADELDQGYMAGQELMQSPIGYDLPPAEEFGLMQQGLETVGSGQIRNPATGDIMPSIKSPTGEIIPAPQTQPEIDALPDGAKYINPETGDVEVVGGGKGGGKTSRSTSRATAAQAVDQLDMSPDDAAAAFEKWNAKQDPMTTAEERAVVDKIISSLPDEQEQQIRAQIEANPEGAIELLSQYAPNMDIGAEFESARITAFANQEKARKGRISKVAQAMGIEVPEPASKPAINPDRYLVETGNQGTTRIRRRGNRQFSIPAVQGEDGQVRFAPNAVRELADLDVDSEFVNIRPTEGGNQVRVLPFSAKTVNLENFALDDQQRAILATESGAIRPRPMQEWNRFEDELRKFEVTNEVWDPNSLTPAQEQLQSLVNNFYRELSPKGRAAMTMYVAHSLGHEISPDRDFTSTGWVKKQIPSQQPAAAEQTPTMMPTQRLASLRQNNIPATIKALDMGSEESYQGNIKNIFQTLSENADYYIAEQGVQSDPRARRRLILEEIDQLAKTVRPGSFENQENYDRFVRDLYGYVGATPDFRATATPPTKPAAQAPQATKPTQKPVSAPKPAPTQAEIDRKKSETAVQRRKEMTGESRRGAYSDYLDTAKNIDENYDIIARSERLNQAARNEKTNAFKAEQEAATREFERQNLPLSAKRQEEIAEFNRQNPKQTPPPKAVQPPSTRSAEFKAEQREVTGEFERQNLPLSAKRQEEIAAFNAEKAKQDRIRSSRENSPKARAEREENLRIIEKSDELNKAARNKAEAERIRAKYAVKKKTGDKK